MVCMVTIICLAALNFLPSTASPLFEALPIRIVFGLLGAVTAVGGISLWLFMLGYILRRESTTTTKVSLILVLVFLNVFAALFLFFTMYRSELRHVPAG